MTDQPPPILPYQTPTPITPNFGMRAAKVSWLASLAALLAFAIAVFASARRSLFDSWMLVECVAAVPWIIGLVSGVVALAALRRHGRKRILRPALIGLFLNLVVFLLMLALWFIVAMAGIAASVR